MFANKLRKFRSFSIIFDYLFPFKSVRSSRKETFTKINTFKSSRLVRLAFSRQLSGLATRFAVDTSPAPVGLFVPFFFLLELSVFDSQQPSSQTSSSYSYSGRLLFLPPTRSSALETINLTRPPVMRNKRAASISTVQKQKETDCNN